MPNLSASLPQPPIGINSLLPASSNIGGDPEDGPIFYTSFVQTTTMYNYTNLEDNQRLLKCLRGEAQEVVKCMLIHPDNVNAVVEQLRLTFGRPEQLIQSQIRQIRDVFAIPESNIEKLVPSTTKVKNLALFLQASNDDQHLANPSLMEELVLKLPMSKRLQWARVAVSIKPYPVILNFCE